MTSEELKRLQSIAEKYGQKLYSQDYFDQPNVRTEEIEPWEEQGHVWRRLKATFPPEIATHSTEQVFYFDKESLLRRQDYKVDVLEGAPSANYASEHKEFSGLVMTTRRRIYRCRSDGQLW
jgi:hypothetical protein